MADKNQKKKSNKSNSQVEFYNDQIGENAGEGRLIKEVKKSSNVKSK